MTARSIITERSAACLFTDVMAGISSSEISGTSDSRMNSGETEISSTSEKNHCQKAAM